MASLLQEEYETLKAYLREQSVSIEEAETLLNGKYEAMKEINGWTEEGDEPALLVGKPYFKKTFKGQCGYCGNYGYKAVDCHARKANQDNKKNEALIASQENGRFNQDRIKNHSGNKVIQEEKGNLIFPKSSVLVVVNMGILQEIVHKE